ncbi:MAG TPA: hypothetical protein PKW59_09430 [Thermotogota bacterium]|nr:hypothetical protein [Thermotogota bacterium]HPM21985.1 hypothetical protein [Thermotogota bacterium]HQQ66923.1 hypothetical protein [Thermotogota bacterium]
MTQKNASVGYSQRIRLEWFEYTVNLILEGKDKTAINLALQEFLKDKVSVGGSAKGCNREKIISILRTVWLKPSNELEVLRNTGLNFLSIRPSLSIPNDLSIVIHWGMATATYSFWSAVASHTGRLLKLQGFASASQIQRRIRELYGERETVSRATQRVLRTYIDWGVLQETGTKGVYSAGKTIAVKDPQLAVWLVEASLHSRTQGSAPLNELLDNPALFPIRIKPIPAESLLNLSPRLELLRHGLDNELIILKKRNLSYDA